MRYRAELRCFALQPDTRVSFVTFQIPDSVLACPEPTGEP